MKRTMLLLLSVALLTLSVNADELRICGQNVENYYWNYEYTGRTQTSHGWLSNYSDDAGRARKTKYIVNTMLDINADIYAFNEVEACEIILSQLADSLSKYGKAKYATVSDGISYTLGQGYDNHIKSGFVYRTDKVRTIGNNLAGATDTYYKDVMRIQVFEQLSTGERFTLSMNHLKAGGTESDNQKRITNVNQLLTALNNSSLDPDILVMGDMNCWYGSEPLQILVNKGYEEQLLRFDPYAYNMCEYEESFIDHVFANSTMAEYVKDAEFVHISDCADPIYSDHNPYIVTVDFNPSIVPCENIDYSETFTTSIGDWTHYETQTNGGYWGYWNQKNCVYISGYKKSGISDSWLISPVFDLTGKGSANVSFLLRCQYGTQNNYSQNVRMYITDNFTNVQETEWTQITGLKYSNNWSNGQQNTLQIPTEYLGKENVTLAFRYTTTDTGNDAPNVGLNNFNFKAECGTASSVDNVIDNTSANRAQKIIENGTFYILRDGKRYTITGIEVGDR